MKLNPSHFSSRGVAVAVVALVTLLHSHASGQVLLIDDFETFTNGQAIATNNGWVAGQPDATNIQARTDPSDSSNMTLAAVGSARGVYKSASILDGETLTLRFDFRLQGTTNDVTLGMTAASSPNLATDAVSNGPSVRVLSSNLNVFDGSTSTATNGVLAIDVWYTLDMVINNDVQTFSAFLNGGAYNNTLLVGNAKSTFAFRAPIADSNLTKFALRSNANNTTTASASLLIDNIAIIPEPSSSLLMAIGLSVLAFTRRRKGI